MVEQWSTNILQGHVEKTPTVGLESTTTRLRALRSTDWAGRAWERHSSMHLGHGAIMFSWLLKMLKSQPIKETYNRGVVLQLFVSMRIYGLGSSDARNAVNAKVFKQWHSPMGNELTDGTQFLQWSMSAFGCIMSVDGCILISVQCMYQSPLKSGTAHKQHAHLCNGHSSSMK